MKIFIFWAWGSWKSFLAEKIEKVYSIQKIELDSVFQGITKEEIRSAIIRDIISKNKSYILEGHYQQKWVNDILIDCDHIVLIRIPSRLRKYRLISRTLKRMLWFEKTHFISDFKTIIALLRFDNKYQNENREMNFLNRVRSLGCEKKLYSIPDTTEKNIKRLIEYFNVL